jgi:uncharacterized protein YeaO (DUF488 family)
MLQLKCVHEPSFKRDGLRFLFEWLWPRGVLKQDLTIDAWQEDAEMIKRRGLFGFTSRAG